MSMQYPIDDPEWPYEESDETLEGERENREQMHDDKQWENLPNLG